MKISEVPGIKTLENSRVLCGVYFFFILDELVYVGQSTNIRKRIAAHQLENKINFDSVFYIEVDEDKLIQVEKGYIVKYDPKYNQTHIFERELIKIRRILNKDPGQRADEPEILVNDFVKQKITKDRIKKKQTQKQTRPKNIINKADVDIRFRISKKDFRDLMDIASGYANRHLLGRAVFMEFVNKYRKAKKNKEI